MTVEAISIEELKARYGTRRKPSKFKNRVCREDGYSFDSEAERERYRELKLLVKGGNISNLKVHPWYLFRVNGQNICRYEADFSYFDQNAALRCTHGDPLQCRVVEDVKGHETALFKIKAKLFRALYPGDELRLILVK